MASTRDPVARWVGIARQAQDATGIPANVLLGLIRVESGGTEGRTSSAGAGGLTQFIPSTAREYGVDVRPGHARSQILGAAKYLAALGFNRNPQQALNAYNGAQVIGGRANPYAGNVLAAARSYGSVPAGPAAPSPAGGSPGGSGGPSFGAANDVSGAVAALLSSARSRQPYAQGPMLPAHAARAVMPQGYQPVFSGGPPVSSAPDVQGLLDAVRTRGGSVPGVGGPSGSETVNGGSGATSVSGAGGSVRVAPGANRPGVGLTPGIVKLVRAVSATAGRPLTIGTGTNHNRMTVDGNVSDHYSGNAADLPTTPGQENIQLGREALVALGVPQSQAAKAQGGIYNIPYGQRRRIQVIFNTNAGGDHHNHVHVGVTAK